MGLKALQRAGLKALPPVGLVQPQPLCLGVIGPDNDHVSPAGGARIALQPGAHGDVVWYDCTRGAQHLFIHKSEKLCKGVCVRILMRNVHRVENESDSNEDS